jgi:hypothetical protein
MPFDFYLGGSHSDRRDDCGSSRFRLGARCVKSEPPTARNGGGHHNDAFVVGCQHASVLSSEEKEVLLEKAHSEEAEPTSRCISSRASEGWLISWSEEHSMPL